MAAVDTLIVDKTGSLTMGKPKLTDTVALGGVAEAKKDQIDQVRRDGHKIAMAGNRVNDAPAQAAADVGIAMGTGADVALETADAALLRNRVMDVAGTIPLSRAAMAKIRQNVAIALGLKGLFLITNVLGVTVLWIAILADTGATVIATLNALCLLAFNPEREA